MAARGSRAPANDPLTPVLPPHLHKLIRPGHNLPLPVTSFIGREHQIAEIKRLLQSPSGPDRSDGSQGRILTLTGPGGCGKTRLAIRVALEIVPEFPDGVWWIELEAVSDPTLVPQAVVAALGVSEQTNRPLMETLLDALWSRRMLLVLDNCEHLLAACGRLARTLLQACPDLLILATSRAVLNIPGEIAWAVPSLTYPDRQDAYPSEMDLATRLNHYESVRLFLERAAAVPPGFILTDQNAAGVAQICHRLDGIPLAIELAAARVKLLTVQQIASRLDHCFNLLSRGSEIVSPRHQTLRATVEWSYDLLPEKEQALLRRLSVFAGSFTLSAAEVICTGADLAEVETLDLLSDLVDESLVLVSEREPLEEARYRLLEMIRQFSQEKLEEAGEAGSVQDRYLDFFLRLAEEAEPKLISAEQVAWLRRLDAEYDNLREAIRWLTTNQGLEPDVQSEYARSALRLAGALWLYWEIRGYFAEGRGWLERALAISSVEPALARAKALSGAGTFAWRQGDIPQAINYHQESLDLYRELGDLSGTAFALNNLAVQVHDQGEHERATSLLEGALDLYREIGEAWGLALVLNNMASIMLDLGDHKRAATLLEEGLVFARQSGDQRFIAGVLIHLGELTHDQGEDRQALIHFGEALRLYDELGDRLPPTYIRCMLGEIAYNQGDLGRATALFRESLAVCRELGNKRGLAESLEGLAKVLQAGDNLQAAVRLLGFAESLRQATGMPLMQAEQAQYDRNLAALRARLGDDSFAEELAIGHAMALDQATSYANLHASITESAAQPKSSASQPRLRSLREATRLELGGLTARESQVAVLIAWGRSNREIASELVVGLKTVEAHVTRILSKLGFTSRAQIAAWAVAKGLAEAPHDLDSLAKQD